MSRVVGDIAVKVGADVTPLQRNMKRAGQSVDDFDKRAKAMALNVAKAGAAIAGAMAAATTAILAAGREAAAVGVEIRNLSAIAGVGTTEFQKYSAASRSVGIEQEKLADIFKDVNDKFGDFMATGAGPLADFFENIAPQVGVTADQFARLSGPEALQLYVSSLEQAGVSQQQMTFYMEALASDATALIPLLRNGGQAMRQLGQEAQDAGRILDEDMIARAAELDQELRNLSDTIKMNATKAVLEHKDEIVLLANFITETLIPAVAGLAEALGTIALGWKTIAQEARDAIEPITRALNLSAQMPGASESGNIVPPPPDGYRDGSGDTSSTGTGYVDDNGNWVEYGTSDPAASAVVPGITAPSLPMTMGGPLDPSGGLLPEKTPLELAREAWESRLELEEEMSDRLTGIRKDALEDIEEVEEISNRQKIDSLRGVFGDLSSLMKTENKKLFKIGQAAALAETIISGAFAAQKAYEGGLRVSGGQPAVGALYAAASLAATATQVAAIKSASSSGGGSSSGGSGGGSVGTGGAQAPQQEVTTFAFTLQNDSLGIGESITRQIVDAINETGRNGGRFQAVLT